MTSRQVLARYEPLAAAGLTMVGVVLTSVAPGVAAGATAGAAVLDGASAVAGLKRPSLAKELEKACCQSLADGLEDPRTKAGGEAGAVEREITEAIGPLVQENRQALLLAALDGPRAFRKALPTLDLTDFTPAARHYADRILQQLGDLVRGLALSPEVYPALGQAQLRDLGTALRGLSERVARLEAGPVEGPTGLGGEVAGLQRGHALLEARLGELDAALVALQQELDRCPPRIVEVGSMPERAAHFVERADLDRVRQVMATSGTRVLCAVSGMRGVGKSQLAAAFANECIDDGWGFVAWVSATSRAAAVAQMAQIARGHQLVQGDEAKDDERAAQWLVSWLSGTGPDPRLLVFDNVESADDLAGLIPKGPGMRVLVTTTRTDVPGEPLDIGVYTLEEAIGYLVEATGNPDRDGAKDVAEALGCLPVALTQAAVTIQTWCNGYTDYLADLDVEPLDEVLDQAGDPYPAKAGAAIRMAFRVVASRLATESPALGASATAILDALSVLAEGGVPRQWLYGSTGDVQVDRQAVGLLVRYNILTKSRSGNVVSLHRLQARVHREDLTEAARLPEAADTAARVLSHVDIPDDAGWEEKQATARALATQLVEFLGQTYSEPVTRDLRVLGISVSAMKWCFEAGLAGLAVQLAPYTDLHERVLGRDHPGTLTTRNNLAAAYRAAGRLGEAVPLLEGTLADHVRVLGPDHPDTLTTRNNLAAAYRAAGRLGEAVPLLEGTLADHVRVLGPDHPDTLTSRSNLAAAYRAAGRLGEAVPLFEETLADHVRLLGRDHPDTLTSRSNLAAAYRAAGRLGEAVPLYEETLADRVRLLGRDHPDTLTSRSNLAAAYRDAGRLGEAVPLLEETLAEQERVLGRDHPSTLTTRGNLAVAYRAAGRLGEAVPLLEETLAEQERVLGRDHPSTLTTRGNLAVAYRAAGRLGEAVPLLEETLAEQERVLGRDHPSTLTSRNNLALAYQDAGRLGEAVPLLEGTLAEQERVLGRDHPSTLTSRNNLALAYQDAGRLGEAVPLFEEVLADHVRVLGPDHPDTLTTRGNLAGAYWDAGRLGEAVPLYEQALEGLERVLGPEHPDTVAIRRAWEKH